MKILLVCYGGLSTSILVTNMQKAIANSEKFKNRGIIIEAWGKEEYFNNLENTDILLLGPQLAMAKETIEKTLKANNYNIPVVIINKEDYGAMNAIPILKEAFAIIKNQREKVA